MNLNRVSLVTWHFKWGSCWLGAHHTGYFLGCANRALLLKHILLSMCSVLCLIIFKNVRCQPHPGLIFLSLLDEGIVIGCPGTTEWGIHGLNVLTACVFDNINMHFFHFVFCVWCFVFSVCLLKGWSIQKWKFCHLLASFQNCDFLTKEFRLPLIYIVILHGNFEEYCFGSHWLPL